MAYILTINGSYRKDGIIDQCLHAMLIPLIAAGHKVEQLKLSDMRLLHCTNCRTCTQKRAEGPRGECILEDDMQTIYKKIDLCDAMVLAAPINFGTITALMKCFIERTLPYAYWPWGQWAPKFRIAKPVKKAALVTASACPACIGRVLMPTPLRQLKQCARIVGARPVKALYFGGICIDRGQRLKEKDLLKAAKVGMRLTA